MRNVGWITVLVGLVLGMAAGVTYAWKIDPVAYVDTAPGSLRADFRAQYLVLIASAYAGRPDLPRARARLALLPDPNPADTLAAMAQQLLAAGQTASEARAMARLAQDLRGGAAPPPASPVRPTAGVAAATSTPSRAPAPTATRPPSATPGAPFVLASQELLCVPGAPLPLIQVRVFDASGNPVPGQEFLVLWDQGQGHFFTGLKPELGLGYGDFAMEPEVSYTLQMVSSGEVVVGLRPQTCPSPDGEPFWGSWLLTFVQP